MFGSSFGNCTMHFFTFPRAGRMKRGEEGWIEEEVLCVEEMSTLHPYLMSSKDGMWSDESAEGGGTGRGGEWVKRGCGVRTRCKVREGRGVRRKEQEGLECEGGQTRGVQDRAWRRRAEGVPLPRSSASACTTTALPTMELGPVRGICTPGSSSRHGREGDSKKHGQKATATTRDTQVYQQGESAHCQEQQQQQQNRT